MSSLLSCLVLLLVALCLPLVSSAASVYPVSIASGWGRRFDGIGGLSGGGCTSRMLIDYPDPYRAQILDYLFLPNFAASLHILKVEIGGDVQSTEGTEPSHMHEGNEQNYNRGYEWWLMQEAKKRNPSVLLSALSWGFPQWVSEGTGKPFTNSTVTYIINWLKAARDVYQLHIDYVGIWNERGYTDDYIISLRKGIDAAGLSTLIVVGHDNGWDICADINTNIALAQAVAVIGAHCNIPTDTYTYIDRHTHTCDSYRAVALSCVDPGTSTQPECSETGKPLWASEDFAQTYNAGGPCWARILNQNYVRGNMTSTIAWNLITTYYDELTFSFDGLMHAVTPWDGHYDVGPPIWVTAHHTHFTQPGWRYLKHGQGVGLLDKGGSYVALSDGTQLTIVIELMHSESSQCHWGSGPSYTVAADTATFQLDDSFSHVQQLYVYTTNLTDYNNVSATFVSLGAQPLVKGAITLQVQPSMVYTLSTLSSKKQAYASPPAPTPFPLPYMDDFDSRALESEAPYFFDQAGSWQIVNSGGGKPGRSMRQQVLQPPVSWCTENPVPYSVIGNHQWTALNVSSQVLVETTGTAFIAAVVSQGGCQDGKGYGGITFGIYTDGTNGYASLCPTTAFTKCTDNTVFHVTSATWYSLRLIVRDTHSEGYINGVLIINSTVIHIGPNAPGWAGIGSSWNYVQFDSFTVQAVSDSAENQLPAEE